MNDVDIKPDFVFLVHSCGDDIKYHNTSRKDALLRWISESILDTIQQYINSQGRMGKFRCERNV